MINDVLALIADKARGFKPRIGLVLGSGMGDFVDEVERQIAFPYGELPGFPKTHVVGHPGRLVLGWVGPTPVAVLQGRSHFYEHGDAATMKLPIQTLAALGCEALVVTNAGGSLRGDWGPGSVVMIADHISLTQISPLFNETGNQRFVDMVDAYDPAMRRGLAATAKELGMPLPEGVYVWFSGPQFETPAEVRAARILGGDIVGMSTAPDVILARHAGMKAVGFSIITNFGAGMTDEVFSHEHTMEQAGVAAAKLGELLAAYLKGLKWMGPA
jgi:purine-nucleoside phosphorylase